MTPDELVDALLADTAPDLLDARLLRIIPIALPAAGADFTITVPAGDMWEVRSVRGLLTTSAAAANRVPQLIIDDGANELLRTASATAIVASTVGIVQAFVGAGTDSAPGTLRLLPFPAVPMIMVGGWRLRSLTTLIDVGDQWSAIFAVVRRISMADIAQAAAWLSRQMIATEIPT